MTGSQGWAEGSLRGTRPPPPKITFTWLVIVHPSVRWPCCPPLQLSVHAFFCSLSGLSAYELIRPSICPLTFPSICSFVRLSVSPYIPIAVSGTSLQPFVRPIMYPISVQLISFSSVCPTLHSLTCIFGSDCSCFWQSIYPPGCSPLSSSIHPFGSRLPSIHPLWSPEKKRPLCSSLEGSHLKKVPDSFRLILLPSISTLPAQTERTSDHFYKHFYISSTGECSKTLQVLSPKTCCLLQYPVLFPEIRCGYYRKNCSMQP